MESENKIEVLVVNCKMPRFKRRVLLMFSIIMGILLVGGVPNSYSTSAMILVETTAIVATLVFIITCIIREIYLMFEPSSAAIYNGRINIEGYEPGIVEAEFIEPDFYSKLHKLDNILILKISKDDRRTLNLYLKDEDGTLKDKVETLLNIK